MKGREYEDLAARYLKSKGYQILGRNLRSPYGEIDILAEFEGRKVIVEVKGSETFFPAEKVTPHKLSKIIRTAYEVLGEEPFSIEVVVVYRGKVYHYKDLGLEL
ncbi:YraN family protein [Aquifex aeolicus]|uniref:UPF0102 protein aq_041 n=1 Tax=Aquifex aeolicus (strain VF5) TaxID=224324 RepID=Y041_AQUAE|nr:YraN family protein [Aquifex aeolicus]O66457.1 RecName: Full=UPF0102 protein aq_041 [Aquifex aeolicus VF5]AAC06429.1 putative protein [Aquifex aeolicus VF5]